MSQISTVQQMKYANWMKIFQAKEESGLSGRAFCRLNNISYEQYKYRLRKARLQQLNQMSSIVELPQSVPLVEPMPEEYPFTPESKLLLRVNGAEITVTSSTSPELLRNVLEVLKNV